MENQRVKVFTLGLMEAHMMANSKMVLRMEKVIGRRHLMSLVVRRMNTLDVTKEIRNVDKENSNGQVETCTRVNTKMTRETAMER